LDFGKEQQVNGYAYQDQCYLANLKREKETFTRLKTDWSTGREDAEATRAVLDVMRTASPEEACADVAKRLTDGRTTAGAVWDAVYLAAAELRMRARSSGLVAIHAVTSANGLRHAYLSAAEPQTRYLLLLQAVGWMGQFRTWAAARDANLRSFQITELEPPEGAPEPAEIFGEIPAKADDVAPKVFGLACGQATREAFLAGAKRLVVSKSEEPHYYKYAAAIIEDLPLVSPRWQPHVLAALVYYLKGSKDADAAVVRRAREFVS
jgi:hypothetical protein